jgi:hypothetical protein
MESSFTWCPLHTFVDGVVTEIRSSLRRRIVLRLGESLFGRLFLVRSTEVNELRSAFRSRVGSEEVSDVNYAFRVQE